MPAKKLAKILEHESGSLDDRTVIGGLARYADTWEREARAAYGASAASWVQEVADGLRAYESLSSDADRRQSMDDLRRMVEFGPPSDQGASTAGQPQAGGPDDAVAASDRRADSGGDENSAGPEKPGRARRQDSAPTGLGSPTTALRGVGPRQAKRLDTLGMHTIRDMLYFFPRRYDDYSKLCTIRRLNLGDEVTVIGLVQSTNLRRSKKGSTVFRATLADGTGTVRVTWFNQPYLDGVIKKGQQLVVSGTVDQYLGRLCFNSPQWETMEQELLHTARIVPVYRLTAGVRAKWLRRLMKRTVDYWTKRLPDHLPISVRDETGVTDLEFAICQAHFPDSHASLRDARYRLAFDELFSLQIGLQRQRHEWREALAPRVPTDEQALQDFLASLPYQLTQAQTTALHQTLTDMDSPVPMTRLLQGDVGSGKTVVAAAALAMVAAAGGQAAMMAPTEILAEQHFASLRRMFEYAGPGGPRIRLLTGSVKGEVREEIYRGLADGGVDIVVGTHALIQGDVSYADLRLAIVDEQHRFGVQQRADLRHKGTHPHLLTMTATPIPRSLELTIWGHVDVSTIDEMPAGRLPIRTLVVPPVEREAAYEFVRREVGKGRQAFIICPLVEESDKIDAKAAVSEHERLQREVFPGLRLGLLHGRMRSDNKESTMAAFVSGEFDVLVATSVVEVGIDVPNATAMVIEGADRFGLAQLHQFRGRVGRGPYPSTCLLLSDVSDGPGHERLATMEKTPDGFVLAQKDLEMRGPGEFLGTRQSGYPPLELADATDVPLIEKARDAALTYFATDPDLTSPDSRLLARHVEQMWQAAKELD